MRSTFRKLFYILSPSERISAMWVFLLMVVVGFFEAAGVASILPFISVLSDPETVTTQPLLNAAYEWSGFDNVDQFTVALGIGFLVVFFISLTLKAASQWVQVHFTKMRVHSVGCRLMKGYLDQPYEWFLGQHTSKMTTTILSEVNQVISKSLFRAVQMVAQLIVVASLLVLIFLIDPVLAMSASILLGAAYIVVYLLVRGPLFRYGRRRYEANLKRYRVTQETFGGVKDIKVGCMEGNMIDRFTGPSFQTAHQEVKAAVVTQIPGFLMQAIVFGGVVGVLLYLKQVYGSMAGALPVFSAFAFAGYRLMPALQQVYRHITTIRSNSAALDGLVAELGSLRSVGAQEVADKGERFGAVEKAIELKNIHYKYPAADEEALQGVSLRIGAKQRIGLVGASGSGKTTTVDIILGLLKPSSGSMLVDGTVITDDNVRSWQRAIGYVPQHIFLADETIAANIAFGMKPGDIDMDAVIRAAKIANLHEFILSELPNGYETEVGERGVRLSGGQRQRIGIARALYHDPDVLVLDEATSALDNQTEHAVMQAVENLGHQKTIILIAHRLSTVRSCDTIYMLSHGKVVGQGPFDELIRNNAEFSAMAAHDTDPA
ncbi:ABC transporter ATP-binding protein [Marinobacter flavimaris]|uniref:ABC transporter ATP-binding protein n=1 Tax=Marinobacter flavimaris TaxID=262076 RepID=UPI003870A653